MAIVAAVFVVPGALAPLPAAAQSEQFADTAFVYQNSDPAWPAGKGPTILFSNENSSYVQNGLARPLMTLLEGDGFVADIVEGELTREALDKGAILALINPYRHDYANSPAIDPPSAFTEREIEAVHQWVSEGGSLLILADHAPLGGGSSKLAATFGFTFLNGHVVETGPADSGIVSADIDFTATTGLNTSSPITNGGLGRKPVHRFYCFDGQAFIPPDGAVVLLRIQEGWSAVFSYRIDTEIARAPRIDARGMAQGAVLEYGKGRVAVFGETGSFSAQELDDGEKFGFNTPEGAENPEFILSVARWLARYAPGG